MTGAWLDETRARLGRAVERLDEKRREARSTFELKRLEGKIEGVKLALSYLDEESRTAPTGVWLDPDDREQMEALARVSCDEHNNPGYFDGLTLASQEVRIEAMTAAVRSLLPPPPKVKPEEPTEWGSLVRDDGVMYVASWRSIAVGSIFWSREDGAARRWSDFSDDVEILRVGTGVES